MTHNMKSHSGISGSTPTCGYPELIATCYALHRKLSRDIHYAALVYWIILKSEP
jgi:hypothetical protein